MKPFVNEHLANERTLLAWVRTAVGIMAFGFVVVRFSLFTKQLSLLIGKDVGSSPKEYTSISGVILVVIGIIVLPLSYYSYKRTQEQLNEGKFAEQNVVPFLLVCLIVAISLLLVYFLVEGIVKAL